MDRSVFAGYDKINKYPCTPSIMSAGFTKLMYLLVCHQKPTALNTGIICKYIAENSVEINAKNNAGWTALDIVCYNAEKYAYAVDVVECLLTYGANVDTKVNGGTNAHISALTFAVNRSRHCKYVLKTLLKYGVNVNHDNGEWSPLAIAARTSNTTSDARTVALLLENGANVNWMCNTGWTPLMVAVRYSNTDSSMETVKLLLDNGADVNAQQTNGMSVLMLAAKFSNAESNIDALKLLLECGADVELQDKDGMTALMATRFASTTSNTEAAEMLLNHGANVNSIDNDGFSVLAHGIIGLNMQTLKLLLLRGADPTNECIWNGDVKDLRAEHIALLLAYCPGDKLMNIYDITKDANVKLSVLKHLECHYHAKKCKNNVVNQIPTIVNEMSNSPESFRVQLLIIYKDKH